ncbi:MAG: peroxiredoxin [Asgard group archaeon]|nr:peroxiredoxin [Asgard group archaeon]
MKVSIGDKAPDFCLSDKDDQKICLKDNLGKWLILYFYPKDNSKSCTREAIDFTSNLDDFHKMNSIVFGISPDSIKSHQKFADKHDLKVHLLSDEDKKLLKEYGVWQKKSMFGREFMGVVRSTVLINPEGKIAEIWENVRVPNHVKNVKTRLKELQK